MAGPLARDRDRLPTHIHNLRDLGSLSSNRQNAQMLFNMEGISPSPGAPTEMLSRFLIRGECLRFPERKNNTRAFRGGRKFNTDLKGVWVQLTVSSQFATATKPGGEVEQLLRRKLNEMWKLRRINSQIFSCQMGFLWKPIPAILKDSFFSVF